MIKMTIQDTEETAEFKVLEKPIIQKPLIAESDVVTIDNNLSTYVTGTQKRELTVGLGYLDSIGYETLRRIRDRQYAVLKYPTVTITADEPVDLGYGEDVPSYRQRLVQLKGKNLYDKNSADVNYYLGTSSVAQNSSGNGWSILLPIDAGETYTFSRDHTVGSQAPDCNYAFIATQPTNGTPYVGSRVSFGSNDTFTATAPTGAKYLMVYYAWNTNATNRALAKATFQLELGSTATTYEPYTDIELCKIGDYQDYIYKSGDKWYVHKAVGKVVLDGSETWVIASENIWGNRSFACTNTAPGVKSWGRSASDRFIDAGLSEAAIIEDGSMQLAGGGLVIRYTGVSTGAEFRTYLSSHPANFYYQLSTPTETEITNDTLKAQLNALQNSAFDRWTKVETNVQEPALQPYLTVTQGEITGSGKEVMLEGTTEDLLDFVIFGDTFQQTYSGKNLFGATLAQLKTFNTAGSWDANDAYTYRGVKYTPIYENNCLLRIELSGTATANSNFVLCKISTSDVGNIVTIGNTYTLSGCPAGGSTSTYYLRVQEQPYKQLYTETGAAYSRAFPTLSTGATELREVIGVDNGTNVTGKTYYPQFESGSPATAFEPYVGGVPAPNPSYPQDVRTVNGSINFDFSGPSGVRKYTMVGKMTLADQRIIDNCGTNEQVQVSFRESKQL